MSSKTNESSIDLPSFRRILQELQPPRRPGDTPDGTDAALKRSLHEVTTRLIDDFWIRTLEHRNRYADVWGLTREGAPVDRRELETELVRLFNRSPDYPAGRLRALTSEVSVEIVARTLRESAHAPDHVRLLRRIPNPWFRNYAESHLRVGVHTGISAAYKMIESVGGAFLRLGEPAFENFSGEFGRLLDEAMRLLQFVAASHFDLLLAVEGCVWDSAASMPNRAFSIEMRDGAPALVIARAEADRIAARAKKSGFKEERLGCPALASRWENGNVVGGLVEWCAEISRALYLPLLIRERAAPRPSIIPA